MIGRLGKLGRLGALGGSLPIGNINYKALIPSIFGSSLIGYWPLDDASGSVAIDMSGLSHNAAYIGSPTYGESGIDDGGKSVLMMAPAGINLFSAGLAEVVNLNQGFIGVWVKPVSTDMYSSGAVRYISTIGGPTSSRSAVEFRTHPSNHYFWAPFRRDGVNRSIVVPTPKTARWVHLGFSWDVVSGKIKMYQNGVLCGSSSGIAPIDGGLNSDMATLSNDYASEAGTWSGYTAHGVLTNSTPTDDQVFRMVRPKGCVVFEGDSRTAGKSWPSNSLDDAKSEGDFAFGKRGFAIQATSGSTNSDIVARASATDSLLKSASTGNVLCVWYGVNDWSLSAETIYNNIVSYCTARRSAGWNKIVVSTEIDAQGAVPLASWHNGKYQALNTLLRSNWASFADGVCDLGADVRLQDATNTTYYTGDQVHPNDGGAAVIGSLMASALSSVI